MGTSKNSCKTAAVMNLLSRSAGDRVLPAQPKEAQPRDIEVITREFLDAKRTAGEAFITMGQRLIEAKASLPHGEWLSWLAERAEFSEASAQKYMKLAREYSNPESIRDLGYTKALILLALPDGEREAFIETPHLVDGEEKMVADMSQRELKAALKERDEARLAAEQAKANEQAAIDAREKISRDMALANERLAGLNSEVHALRSNAKIAKELAAKMEKELAELRARPVDVAVERDDAAIEAARQETRDFMQFELDEAQKGWAEASDALETAQKAQAEAQQRVDELQAELDGLRFELERKEKKAALTSDADLILFNELLSQGQTIANRMNGVILKKRDKEPETAEKLRTATLALSDVYRKAAQG